MIRQFWYDRRGRPIGIEEAERLLGSPEQLVELTDVGDRWRVSTIHTVLDQTIGELGPPLIFETAVFDRLDSLTGPPLLVDFTRSPTEAAAMSTHDQVCARLRDGWDPTSET